MREPNMRVGIIGVPMDLGGRRRGTDMGPSAIRYAGLNEYLAEMGCDVADLGNVSVNIRETRLVGDPKVKYLSEVIHVCTVLARQVRRVVEEGRLPIVLGGDHSIAVGTVGGLVQAGRNVGIIWLDAHGDFNTPETTPSGSVHGMPLAAIVGRGHPEFVACCSPVVPMVPEHAAVLVGVRDLDPLEKEALRASSVTVFSMKDIDEAGIGPVMRRAVEVAGDGGRRQIHLTMDMDVVDPMFAPGVGTPDPGGLTYREAHLAMEILAESGQVGSVELTEVNPIFDQGNKTARLAVELIGSVLGKTII